MLEAKNVEVQPADKLVSPATSTEILILLSPQRLRITEVSAIRIHKLLAVPTARVARRLTPRTCGTGHQLVGGVAPKPPFVSMCSSILK